MPSPTPRSSAVHCWKITGENKLSLLKKWAFTTGVWGKHVASGAPRETSSPPDDASELARLPTRVWSVLNKWLCILSPSLYLLQGRTDLASLIIQSRYHEDQRSKEERLFSWLRFVQIYPMLSEGLRTSEGNFWVVYQLLISPRNYELIKRLIKSRWICSCYFKLIKPEKAKFYYVVLLEVLNVEFIHITSCTWLLPGIHRRGQLVGRRISISGNIFQNRLTPLSCIILTATFLNAVAVDETYFSIYISKQL